MGLMLNNARLNVSMGKNYSPPPQRIKPARPSIAEDAVFIPKPHKRVDFKLDAGAGGPGGGQNVSLKNLGDHGVTAEFGSDAQLANGAPKVVMEVIANPQKDFSAIQTQEEGRQTHNARTVNFTQAYDAYGRPRIGFSREPYDFAATKYMTKTSELKFQQNMREQQAAYDEYFFTAEKMLSGEAKKAAAAQEHLTTGAVDNTVVDKGMLQPDPNKMVIGTNVAEAAAERQDGLSAKDVAASMGMDVTSVMVPKAVEKGDEAEAKDGPGEESAEGVPDGKAKADHPGAKAADAYLSKEAPGTGKVSVSA